MIIVIGQNRYDVPHALKVAQIIKKTKPDAVALELPEGFQKVIDKFEKGKVKPKDLDREFGKLIGRSMEIDETLVDKFEKKKIKTMDLGQYSPDGAFIHMILAARKAGAKVFAIDIKIKEMRKGIEKSLNVKNKDRVVEKAERRVVTPSQGVLFFSELVHAPFHFLELILGHSPHDNPFNHPPECRICKWGVSWERFWHSVLANVLNLLPGDQSDYLYALHKYDRLREKTMASRIAEIDKKNKKVLAVVHAWHEMAIESHLEDMGMPVRELTF